MESIIPSNIHQMTPQISSQQWVTSTHNGGNNEHVQKFDEVVSEQQQWQIATLSYFISRTCALTQTTIFAKLWYHKPNPNMDLMTSNFEMEQIQLTNQLE